MKTRYVVGAVSVLFMLLSLDCAPPRPGIRWKLSWQSTAFRASRRSWAMNYWCYILDYNISFQNDGWSPGVQTASVGTPSAMFVTKAVDKASPLLFMAVVTGQICASSAPPPAVVYHAAIDVLRIGGDRTPKLYVRWGFKDVFVSSYNTARSGDNILEMVALDYGHITYEYYPVNPDGTSGSPIGFTWNRPTNTAEAFGEGDWSQFQFLSEFHDTPTPEPATLASLASGLAVFIGWRLMPPSDLRARSV